MEKKQSLLWRIESKNNEIPSWLFGTMHIKDAKAFGLTEKLFACIDQSKAFATELNLDEIKNTGGGAFKLAPTPPLFHLLSPKHYRKLKKILKKALNIEIDRFAGMHPMFLNNMISEAIMASEMPVFLDNHLWEYAAQKGKKGFGLETIEEQMQLMFSMPLQDHIDSLVVISKQYTRFRRGLLRMLHLYEKGDLRALHKAALKSAGKHKQAMIYQRNEIMANRMSTLIELEGSVFCAIGAGHLTGEKGVLRMLKQNGFKVKPVF